MYYSHGDVKDSYEEGYIKDSLSQHFNIETDEEIQKFLDDYAHLYENYENLIYKS